VQVIEALKAAGVEDPVSHRTAASRRLELRLKEGASLTPYEAPRSHFPDAAEVSLKIESLPKDTEEDYDEAMMARNPQWKELSAKNFERKPGHLTPKGYVEDCATAGPTFQKMALINPAGLFKAATVKKEWTTGTAREDPPLLLGGEAPKPRARVVKSRWDSEADAGNHKHLIK